MYSLIQPDQGFEPYLPAGSRFIRWWENRGPEIGSTGTAFCNNIVTHRHTHRHRQARDRYRRNIADLRNLLTDGE